MRPTPVPKYLLKTGICTKYKVHDWYFRVPFNKPHNMGGVYFNSCEKHDYRKGIWALRRVCAILANFGQINPTVWALSSNKSIKIIL